MKLFECQNCGQAIFFENTSCENCHYKVGYLASLETMTAVRPNGAEWIALADPTCRYRFCANWEVGVCNWMTGADLAQPFCEACQHNRTVPELSDPRNLPRWQRIEDAKRRLMYTLLKLGLPVPTRASSDPEPLLFDFLASAAPAKVFTGHDNGVITISLLEADDAEREKLRASLHEPYRTLVGHFRHEVGHYYWDKLVRDGGKLEEFRAVFGDERQDYDEALRAHYQNGAPANWRENFVSSYATMHPWEDFAETWAHYLHIIDTLEMAYYFRLRVSPRIKAANGLSATADRDPCTIDDMQTLLGEWLPVTFAVNSLNRSMGQPDLYPFILSPPAIQKLAFVHKLVRKMKSARGTNERTSSGMEKLKSLFRR